MLSHEITTECLFDLIKMFSMCHKLANILSSSLSLLCTTSINVFVVTAVNHTKSSQKTKLCNNELMHKGKVSLSDPALSFFLNNSETNVFLVIRAPFT